MKLIHFKYLLFISVFLGLCSCEHEIDFDFPDYEKIVIFDGHITNEEVSISICHTQSMVDGMKDQTIRNAEVWIASDEGTEEKLVYDELGKFYRSSTGMVGKPGHTYQMRALIDGRNYEATSTMQPPAPVDTIFFRYARLLNDRLFFVCVKGKDPIPGERNYYLCKLMRGDEIFRWNPRSGRSNVNGAFEYDIVCSSESEMDEGIDDDGNIPLMDGDTLRLELMTIDRACSDYYQSLLISERTTANPITNISGGAQGVFMAASVVRPDTLVFNKKEVLKK